MERDPEKEISKIDSSGSDKGEDNVTPPFKRGPASATTQVVDQKESNMGSSDINAATKGASKDKTRKHSAGRKKKEPATTSVANGRPAKKRRKVYVRSLSPEQQEKRRERLLTDQKAEFERQRNEIMDEVPAEYKARFGEVIFSKYQRDWFPSLILSPYDVPPGAVREEWMTMFKNTESRRDKMTFLVYYYGTIKKSDLYGFHPASQIMTYDQGVKEGLHQLPQKVQTKVDAGKKLSKKEEEKLKGIVEMTEDLPKRPEERKRGLCSFKEDFESEAYIEVMMHGSPGDDVDTVSDENESDLDSSEDERDPPPFRTEKPKKKPLPKRKASWVQEQPRADPPSQATEMENIGDAEISSGGDDAKDSDLPEPSSSSDEDEDEAYVGEVRTTRGDFARPKKEHVAREKGSEQKGAPEKVKKRAIQRGRSKIRKKSKKTIENEERDRFLDSFEIFRSPLQHLSSAVRNEDKAAGAIQADEVLKELLGQVSGMAASFIQESGVVQLMKKTKQLLKSEGVDLNTYKDLFELLKATHEAKKDQIPDVPDLKKLTLKWRQQARPKTPETPKKTAAKSDPKGIGVPVSTEASTAEKVPTTVHEPESASGEKPPTSVSSRIVLDPGRSASHGSRGSSVPRTEKKSFSLGSFVRPASSKALTQMTDKVSRPKDPRVSIEKAEVLPIWLTTPPEPDREFASDNDRLLAMEFIQSAASRLPASDVNREYFARALESAIYKWSKSKISLSRLDDYWLKVHSLVGAICGKRDPGSLVKQIANGEFLSAEALVKLDDDALFRSFEGI